MKIGFQSSKYNNLTLLEELKIARKEKIDFFDIFFDGYLPGDVHDDEWKYIKKLRTKDFDFSVHLPIEFTKYDSDTQNEILDFIKKFKPTTTTVHFNTMSYEFYNKLLLEIGNSTMLCIENTIPDNNKLYNNSYLEYMKELAEKKTVNMPVYATFDTGHCNVNGQNTADFLLDLLSYGVEIKTVHAHDNDGSRDSHESIGKGSIDFMTLFSILKERNQTPLVVIEHWTENHLSLKKLRLIEKALNY